MLRRITIFGLRLTRFREWAAVARSEGRRVGVWTVIRSIWAALWGSRNHPRTTARLWRQRMRACAVCPVYDRTRHACSVVHGDARLGCGCWMPAKAWLPGPQCWLRSIGHPGGHTR